jgi:transcriptional regulator with PAS, ATPase and Fis domain
LDKRLVILTPYKGFEVVLDEILEEMNYQPIVIEGQDITIELLNELESQFSDDAYPDVIISRGGVASHISGLYKSTAMVRMEPDYMDVMTAIDKARKYGRKIGIIANPETIYFLKNQRNAIQRIMDLQELRIYPFETIDEIKKQVIYGKMDGMEAMVGGTAALDSGMENDMPVEVIGTSKISAVNAINQAISIINARKKERLQLENLLFVLNFIKEGIMIIKDNRVRLSNTKLQKILRHDPKSTVPTIMGRYMDTIWEFINDADRTKEIINIDKTNYLMEKSRIHNQNFADVIVVFHNVTKIQEQEQKIRSQLHTKGFIAKYAFDDIVGNSQSMESVMEQAIIYAATDANVLISGKSGTGKELLAQSIHNESKRREKPFVAVNCVAIPENLLESELFGYVEGAFSGAKKGGKLGLFELAHEGTLLLDEINSLPIALQGKLLRVIQEKELRRIGSDSVISIDVRIISTTNQNMHTMIENKKFRPDLFYRLNTLNLKVPDLAERKEDILTLANHFCVHYAKKYEMALPTLSQMDKALLDGYGWPGNIRELENVIHRYVILYSQMNSEDLLRNCFEGEEGRYARDHQDHEELSHGWKDVLTIARSTLSEMENEIIMTVLDENKWNREITAEKLGLCRTTLWRKIKQIEEIQS